MDNKKKAAALKRDYITAINRCMVECKDIDLLDLILRLLLRSGREVA